jgi:predicted  nucleic acid-binding Zn-ribbon protein
MLDTIEKLLILQDRDRRIRQVEGELAHIEPERQLLRQKAVGAQGKLEEAKARIKHLESERKNLELEVEAKKALIVRYANQQLQTRKNDEYKALANEIETCKADIFRIEDQEISLMEQSEAAHKDAQDATRLDSETRKLVEEQVVQLGAREKNLKSELEKLQLNRGELAAAVDEIIRGRYERLLRSKGENVVVGVQHGVCGGCHMKLQPQLLVACRSAKELVTCGNCGRILYYTRDMDLAVAD